MSFSAKKLSLRRGLIYIIYFKNTGFGGAIINGGLAGLKESAGADLQSVHFARQLPFLNQPKHGSQIRASRESQDRAEKQMNLWIF